MRNSKGQFIKGSQIKLNTKHSIEAKEKMRKAKLGRKLSEEHKSKIRNKMIGRKITWKEKIAEANRGEKSHNWKGGLDNLNRKIRDCAKYKEWRFTIFTRDYFHCQTCKIKGKNLNVHHIKQLAQIIKEHKIDDVEQALSCEELWDINNGITVCEPCHKEIERIIKN